MRFETISISKEDSITIITLNQPEKMNALSAQMMEELIKALDQTKKDKEAKVLVITGAGKAFCAGGEVAERGISSIAGERSAMENRERLREAQKITLGLRNLDIPTIAMVNGSAVGGGFDITLACDIRIGSEKARFKVAFTSIGLFPGTGGIWLMPRVIGVAKAAEFLFTDRLIEAQEAERIGLLNKLVPSEKLKEETIKIANKIAKGPPIAIKLAKLQLYKGLQLDFPAALEDAAVYETITWSSQDVIEGITAFREKRDPLFKGK